MIDTPTDPSEDHPEGDEDRVRELEAAVARYEDTLEAQEHYLDSMDQVFVAMDDDWRIRSLNERGREVVSLLVGADLPKEELIGRRLWDEWPRHRSQKLYEVCHQAAATGEEYSYERLQSDGEWIRTRVFPSERGVSYVSEHITERKQDELALVRQNERLDSFAKIVSHDLRNPLNVAAGRLELARETGDAEHFEATSRALDRMETLIDDLLTLARGTGGDDQEPIEFASAARDAWSHVDTGEGTLRIEDDGRMLATPSRLAELLENLFRNAIDHGGGDVSVAAGRLSEGFFVEDDGPGIPPSERDSVFDPGVTTNPDGTGFGLMIVREIADEHGWDVEITEGEDGGARFKFVGVQSSGD